MIQGAKQKKPKLEAGDWRATALEMLPELEEEIYDATTPMALWIEINFAFERSYVSQSDFVRRVYAFADWCVEQEQKPEDDAANDLFTCVAVCFYEHIPTHPAARADMPNWFTRAQVAGAKGIFGYLISDSEFDDLLTLFPEPTSTRERKRQRREAA